MAVGRAGLDDPPRDGALLSRVEGDVEEAGPGDVDLGDARRLAQPASEELGDLARRPTGRLGQLKSDVRGVVAVVAVLRPLDGHRLGRLDGEIAGLDGSRDGSDHGIGKLCGGHGGRLSQRGA